MLLVECKRSVHPFVFFQDVVQKPIPDFRSWRVFEMAVSRFRKWTASGWLRCPVHMPLGSTTCRSCGLVVQSALCVAEPRSPARRLNCRGRRSSTGWSFHS